MKTNITGLSGNRNVYYAAKACEGHKGSIVVVSTSEIAERFKDDLSYFMCKKIIVLNEEISSGFIYESRDKSGLQNKISALSGLVNQEDIIVICPISEFVKKYPKVDDFASSIIEFKIGEEASPQGVRKKLSELGYVSAEVTEKRGEFSSRGDILDVYLQGEEYPVRIEFFGDDIDAIRHYNPDTQRSIDNCESIMITPAALFLPSENQRCNALEKIERSCCFENSIDKISDIFETNSSPRIFEEFIDYFDIDTANIWEYLGSEGVTVICDPSRLKDRLEEISSEEQDTTVIERILESDVDAEIYTSFDEHIFDGINLDRVKNSDLKQMTSFNGQLSLLIREIKKFIKGDYEIHIVAQDKQLDGIRSYIQDNDIYGSIIYDDAYLSSGMFSDEDKVCYITLSDIFPKLAGRGKKRKKKKSGGGITFADLHKGDYVVHEQHGIGLFKGIKTLETDGETRDYLQIQYAGEAELYIPVDNMDMVQRYIGSSDAKPKLSKISGGEWKKTRKKAKKAIEAIAEDLIKLYAEREASKGYAFPEDTVWQREFEEDFPYQETEDQLKAIEEIKEDMQSSIPMDRLLCGDVGYGKTEVAARAIFKCISDGKQAVLLAPTTLLVNQHYENLKERFKEFPFEIEMLSRFRTQGEQAEIVRRLGAGTLDFVVGTHRVLSQEIKFKDLGLLVVDEEQRFGVKAKEKIKGIRKNVDVLTLSATPIPRTLNMSLTGIKNISTIEEPPQDRYPVQTYVSEENDEIIKKAIRRELSRGGQAFVVYNRVNGINRIARNIEELLPEARVIVGHGQMDEKRLEDVMKSFVDGEYDVLVATTIIENGIDIPNANTIVILNAEQLGMAQLYQLRGRVGRSNKIAYAYLMHKPNRILTEEARKRLQAIKEFTELGAGFKLAMRDLEIRGSGNVLGEAQSGHVAGIGYELYCKEIDRAVKRLQGKPVAENRPEVVIDIVSPARIPAGYINDESLRLEAYKKIAEIRSTKDADDVIDELIDRYGEIPVMTINLISIAEIKSIAEVIGVSKFTSVGNAIDIEMTEDTAVNPLALVLAKEKFADKLIIKSGKKSGLKLYAEPAGRLQKIVSLMRTLQDGVERADEI